MPARPSDFADHCEACARACDRSAQEMSVECECYGVRGDVEFWHRSAQDARRAAAIYRRVMQSARTAILQMLERERLEPFREAYQTGDMRLLLLHGYTVDGQETSIVELIGRSRGSWSDKARASSAAKRQARREAEKVPA